MKKVVLAILLAGLVSGARADEKVAAPDKPVVVETNNPAEPSAGLFIGLTAGGDIEESEVAYGGQIQMPLNETFFIELSFASITDTFDNEITDGELDMHSVGISIGATTKLAKNCSLYGMFGPNYNTADIDYEVDQTLAPGGAADADIDNEFGFHAAIGSNYQLAEHVKLFVEYRYTFFDLDGDLTITRVDGTRTTGNAESDYDFGVAKVGIGYIY
jgi:opacity protein-like surface antigen